MDGLTTSGIDAVQALSQRGFSSFPDATRAVLEALEAQFATSAVFVGYLDDVGDRFWIIDSAGDETFGLDAGMQLPLNESFCMSMAANRAPQLCNDAAGDPVYGMLAAQQDLDIGSYVGVPLELADGSRVGSLCAIAHQHDAYCETGRQLLVVIARFLAYELERERREAELKRLSAQLREQASTDALTGLLNRRGFLERAEREWKLCQRKAPASYLLVADLNQFKQINDRLGHAAGDRALSLFAQAIQSGARCTDIVGRLGGDEFAVILVDAKHHGPDAFTTRLHKTLTALNSDQQFQLNAATGVTALGAHSSLQQALEAADSQMYANKHKPPHQTTP